MYVLRPLTITDAMLTSNIPEPDTGETVWTAGSYSIGTERISTVTHKVYRSTADSNTLDPTLDTYNADGVGTKWLIVGATNRWRMFDNVISAQSTRASNITVSIEPNQVVDSVAMFGLSGLGVNVTVTDPVAGVVYDNDVDIRDNTSVIDWWSYFTEPVVEKPNIALWDLPGYPNATITITITGTGTVAIGELTTGKYSELGRAQYGTGYQLLNFNVTTRDAFGNITRTRGRRTAKLITYPVKTESQRTQYTFNVLNELRDIPAVYTGSLSDDKTLAYGYHSDVRVNFSTPSLDDVSIEVEELT